MSDVGVGDCGDGESDDLVLANQRLLKRVQTLAMLAVYASRFMDRLTAANPVVAVHTVQQSVEAKDLKKWLNVVFGVERVE